MAVTPRVNVLQKLVDLCQEANGGGYFVQRGPINWASFDFSESPSAISILTPQFTLLAPQFNSITITLEVLQKMSTDAKPLKGLDDDGIERLVLDIEWVLDQLNRASDSHGDAIIVRMDRTGVTAQEISDLDWSVQGFQVTFSVDY